jgi:hypothetical protein
MFAYERDGAVPRLAKHYRDAMERPDDALALGGAVATVSALASGNYILPSVGFGEVLYRHPNQGVVLHGVNGDEVTFAAEKLFCALGLGGRVRTLMAPKREPEYGLGMLWIQHGGAVAGHLWETRRLFMEPGWTLLGAMHPASAVKPWSVCSYHFGAYLFVQAKRPYVRQTPKQGVPSQLIDALAPLTIVRRDPRRIFFTRDAYEILLRGYIGNFKEPYIVHRLLTTAALFAVGENPEDPIVGIDELLAAGELAVPSEELMRSQLAGTRPVVH